MNKIFTMLFLFLGMFISAQDTSKINQLSEVQILGLKSNHLDPVSITSFNTDSISNLNQGQDPFYILNKISPNTYSQSDNGSGSGYSYMRIRGLDQTRINYTLNGIPLNEMEDQGIYFSNMPGFYSNIGKVEIERGVGTSKYGTTSMAGSVNLESRDILNKEFDIEVGYGSYNTNRLNAGFSTGIFQKHFSLSVRGSVLGTNGFKDNSDNRGGNIFYQIGYFGNKNIFKIYGFSGVSQNQMAYIAPTMDQINRNYQVNVNVPSEKDTFSQNFVALNWINHSIKNLTFNTSTYFNNIQGNYFVNNWGVMGVKSYQGGIIHNIIYSKNNHIINGGINYNYYQRYHTGPIYGDIVQYKNLGQKQDFTTYLKSNIYIDNGFYLFGDIQYRYVNFKYQDRNFINNFINPKIGFKWINNNLKYYNDVYFSAGYTHREPTRSDIFGGNDNPNINTDVVTTKYEEVFDVEIGTNIKYNGLKLSANYYMMYFTDEYVATGEISNIGIMIKKTYPNSIRTGLELEISYTVKGFSIGSNLAASYNKIYGGQYPSITPYASPNFIMNNFISYDYKYFMIGVNGNMITRMYLDNTETISTPANYILNSYVGVRYKNFSLISNFNNMVNQKYYIPAGVTMDGGTYYVGSLFSYMTTLKIKF